MWAFFILVGRALNKSLKFDTGRVNGIEIFHNISKDINIDDTMVFCYVLCANIKWASKLILNDAITQVEP